jgi:hypothetical protein
VEAVVGYAAGGAWYIRMVHMACSISSMSCHMPHTRDARHPSALLRDPSMARYHGLADWRMRSYAPGEQLLSRSRPLVDEWHARWGLGRADRAGRPAGRCSCAALRAHAGTCAGRTRRAELVHVTPVADHVLTIHDNTAGCAWPTYHSRTAPHRTAPQAVKLSSLRLIDGEYLYCERRSLTLASDSMARRLLDERYMHTHARAHTHARTHARTLAQAFYDRADLQQAGHGAVRRRLCDGQADAAL